MPIGETKTLPLDYDHLTPDGAESRRLIRTPSYSTTHYRLQAGQILSAFRNRTLERWRSSGTFFPDAVRCGVPTARRRRSPQWRQAYA